MPLWVGGIEPGAGSGLLQVDTWRLIFVCHIDALSEPSAPAFGKESKCPSGIQGISPFNLHNSPSLSVLFRLNSGHKIKANEGC